MKKSTYFLFILLIVSCSKPTPKKIIQDFYGAIATSDIETAERLSTPKTLSYIKDNIGKTFSPTVLSCETKPQQATCDCLLNNSNEIQQIKLVKLNEEWKVDIETSLLNTILQFIKQNHAINGMDTTIYNSIKEGIEASKEKLKKDLDSILKNE